MKTKLYSECCQYKRQHRMYHVIGQKCPCFFEQARRRLTSWLKGSLKVSRSTAEAISEALQKNKKAIKGLGGSAKKFAESI